MKSTPRSKKQRQQKKDSRQKPRRRDEAKLKIPSLVPQKQLRELKASAFNLNGANVAKYPGGMSMWEYGNASTPGGMRIRGREAGGTLIATATGSGYQLLNSSNSQGIDGNLPLNPFFSSRLEKIAEIYDQFKYHKFVVDIVPYKPTSTAGVYFGTVISDSAALTVNPTTQSQFLDGIVNYLAAIYSIARMIYTGDLAQLPRYICSALAAATGNEPADVLSLQGKCFFGCQGVTTTVGDSMATIVVTYDIEFFSPRAPVNEAPPNLFGMSHADLTRLFIRSGTKDIESLRLQSLTNRLRSWLELDNSLVHQAYANAIRRLELEQKSLEKVPSNVEEIKPKFDPQHCDGDIPNVDISVFTLPPSSFQISSVPVVTFDSELHLFLGDGKRFYRCPGTSNDLIDLFESSRAGCLDPFVQPDISKKFQGVSPRYYPSIGRFNYCACGCNDPSHEHRVPAFDDSNLSSDDICEFCGSTADCVGHDLIPQWNIHARSLDSRSSYISMEPNEFYKCCSAIWAEIDYDYDSEQWVLDWLSSPLCEWTSCTGRIAWSNLTDLARKEPCCGQHLCCLTPSSLRNIAMMINTKKILRLSPISLDLFSINSQYKAEISKQFSSLRKRLSQLSDDIDPWSIRPFRDVESASEVNSKKLA